MENFEKSWKGKPKVNFKSSKEYKPCLCDMFIPKILSYDLCDATQKLSLLKPRFVLLFYGTIFLRNALQNPLTSLREAL